MITCFDPTGSSLARGERDGMLSLCHLATSTLLWMQVAHRGLISALAWSPDGLLLASGGQDGMVYLWQATTGTCVGSVVHGRKVKCLSWSLDGETLSAASGRTIHVLTVPPPAGCCGA